MASASWNLWMRARSLFRASSSALRARGRVKRTRLVYLTNINFSMLRRYLNVLFRMGLIEDRGRMLVTTPLGARFVEEYDEFTLNWYFYEDFENSKKKIESKVPVK